MVTSSISRAHYHEDARRDRCACVCVYMDECIYVSVNVYICTAFFGKAIMIDFFSHHDRLY